MQRSSKNPLEQVCVSLQHQLTSISRDRHSEIAERFLAWFGWQEPHPLALPITLSPTSMVSYLLSIRGHGVLAAHFLLPGLLLPPSTIISRGLDFCEVTLPIVAATRAIKVRYAFITDLQRAYLYDTSTEELLVYADSPSELDKEFSEILNMAHVGEGILDELRRHPRSHFARQFREWRASWSNVLAQQWMVPEEEAAVILDCLVLLRWLTEKNVLASTGNHCAVQFAHLLQQACQQEMVSGIGKMFLEFLKDLWKQAGIALCCPLSRAYAVLEQDAVAKPLLREFALISRCKFQLATILESFNYGDASEKARVRMIPEENEERLAAIAAQTIRTVDEFKIELDLLEEGYRAVLYWFDQLVALYERLQREFELQYESHALINQSGPDLFQWSSLDATRPAALRDPLQFAAEHGLVIYYATPHQLRVARLLLYLHLVERCASMKQKLRVFPQVELAFKKRPYMLESDRKMIFQNSIPKTEWDAI